MCVNRAKCINVGCCVDGSGPIDLATANRINASSSRLSAQSGVFRGSQTQLSRFFHFSALPHTHTCLTLYTGTRGDLPCKSHTHTQPLIHRHSNTKRESIENWPIVIQFARQQTINGRQTIRRKTMRSRFVQ